MQNRPNILSIAGHDPTGGAGIQADIETISALGRRAFSLISALTSQNSSNLFSNHPPGYTPNSLSHTLEYAYTDWCTGKLAESLGKESLAEEYYRRGQYYRNVWDDSVHWFRARDENGNWMKWEGRTVHEQGTIEANPLQQGWFVPHDVGGLVRGRGRRRPGSHQFRPLHALQSGDR